MEKNKARRVKVEEENSFQPSKFSLFLLVIFILTSGIVTGLNITRSWPVNQANILPVVKTIPEAASSVLSITNEATQSASPSAIQK